MDRQYDNRGRDQFNVENARDIHIGIAAAQQRVEVSLKGTIAPKHNPLEWVNRTQPQAELLQRMLTGGGLLEVAGQGRLGKTSLAAWLFAHNKEDFEKALWLDAAWIESFDQLARWILQELGYLIGSPWDDKALLHELVRRLTQHSCLLVIDHVEQLPQHAIPLFAEFVQYWQEQEGRSFVLVMTCIGWMSDQQFQFELSGLTPAEGEIFLTMQDHLIQEGVENGLQRLVQVAEGHPDLLRLAANWLKLQSNGEVNASELMFFERLFQNCQGNLAAKVEEVFTELFNQLSERLRSLLLGIAVYRQPFGIEMAQAIQPDAVIADLQWLIEWLFLQEEVGQWVLHPLMRKLIEQRFTESSQFRESHEKAIAYFTSKIKPSKDSIKDCAEELEIFYHYCQLKDYALAEQTINLCAPFLYRRGYNQQLLPFYKQLTQVWKLEHVRDTDDERKLGRAWRRLGTLYLCMGEYQDAISSYNLAQTIFSRLSISEEEAKCIRGIDMVYSATGEYQRAIDFCRQS
nr:hypothetical protein [Leptolyngbya sp. Prado105]